MESAGRFPVVLASAADAGARHLVARWGDARLLTPADLAMPGWRYHSHRDEGSLSISGATVSDAQITGVVTRLPCVLPTELVSIVPEDREYVAAEMTAFLAAWLTQLRCPVLNRPAATSLWGPFFHPEVWVHLASTVGIPVSTMTTRVCDRATMVPAQPPVTMTVTVVGDSATVARGSPAPPALESSGLSDDEAVGYAMRLARAASVELLCVRFGESESAARHVFVGADYLPDVTCPAIADGLRSRLRSPVG